jgi:hypothetical protein
MPARTARLKGYDRGIQGALQGESVLDQRAIQVRCTRALLSAMRLQMKCWPRIELATRKQIGSGDLEY